MCAGNTKLEKWSPSSVRRAGLCEDHFHEDCFTNTAKKDLKRKSVPIPFNEIVFNKNAQNESREIIRAEQVPRYKKTNIKEIQSTEIAASTSTGPIFIHDDVIIDKHPLQRYPVQYEAPHLTFDISMEEEDITEWMHLEPPIHERGLPPLPLNKSTTDKNNEHLELCARKKVPLLSKESIQKEENNMTKINNLYSTIDSLKTKNMKLRKQIRHLKYRLRCTVRIRKMPKNKKQKKRY